MDKETLGSFISDYLTNNGLEDCFLIDININSPKIEIFIDSDQDVTFAKCKQISRHLEERFDKEGWFGINYVLEVSSAGVGRPLLFPRQYKKNVGREIEIKMNDNKTLKGKLLYADDKNISISWEEKIKTGSKKETIVREETIDYLNIEQAKIKISF